jgi:hypothetical protein
MMVIECAGTSCGGTGGSLSSTPVRYYADLSPTPDGGVIADTAIAGGGVPTGGDALLGIDATGAATWRVPYQDQDLIFPRPVVDAAGSSYYVKYPGGHTTLQLIAGDGATVRWSKPVDPTLDHRLAIGANGQLYDFAGNALHGYARNDGRELFTPVALTEFASGSYDRLFAYDNGLILYSGFGKILYVDYAGNVVGGPYTYAVDPASVFERDSAASATGDLFLTWYDQALTPDACLDGSGHTMVAKYTPAGNAWTKPLTYVSRCNRGGPYVAASPNGGAIVSGSSDADATVQSVNASGETTWRQDIAGPSGGVRTVQRAHVDETGQVMLATNFLFLCNYPDRCAGIQISHFSADGTPFTPILRQGSTVANQESWITWSRDNLALTPGLAFVSLSRNDGGFMYYQSNLTYKVDSFPIPGLASEYPQSGLWKLMP